MRYLLALFAVLALLISPVTAVAAPDACGQAASGPMTGIPTAAAPSDHHGKARPDPCCEQGKKAPLSSKSCVQACASLCAVSAVLPVVAIDVTISRDREVYAATTERPWAHAPATDRRPPKLIV
jgi:hypothetical protein